MASLNVSPPSYTHFLLYWDVHVAVWRWSETEYSPSLELPVVKRPF